MSGTMDGPDATPAEPPEDGQSLAALFALGVLAPDEARAVAEAAQFDAALAAEIAAWEARLAPLARLSGEQEPPVDLWPRIQAGLRPSPRVRRAMLEQAQAEARAARGWAAGLGRWLPWAIALAAPAAVLVMLRGPAGPSQMASQVGATRVAALGALSSAAGGWVAAVVPGQGVVLSETSAMPRPVGRDYELWVLAEGAAAPVPVGVIAPAARVVLPGDRVPSGRFKLLVSLEPKGGSPTGLPTGPVLYGGVVSE